MPLTVPSPEPAKRKELNAPVKNPRQRANTSHICRFALWPASEAQLK
jgi:hypothetical protein